MRCSANGPGDPAALDYVVEQVRGSGKVPVWGICLGHQLLCRAVGLETYKLPFGHRGANHPVKDLETGQIEITCRTTASRCWAPAGRGRSTPTSRSAGRPTSASPSLQQLNLYDRTVEGLVLRDVHGVDGTTPRPGSGPHDALHLFDRFLERLIAA